MCGTSVVSNSCEVTDPVAVSAYNTTKNLVFKISNGLTLSFHQLTPALPRSTAGVRQRVAVRFLIRGSVAENVGDG